MYRFLIRCKYRHIFNVSIYLHNLVSCISRFFNVIRNGIFFCLFSGGVPWRIGKFFFCFESLALRIFTRRRTSNYRKIRATNFLPKCTFFHLTRTAEITMLHDLHARWLIKRFLFFSPKRTLPRRRRYSTHKVSHILLKYSSNAIFDSKTDFHKNK